jgi:hypothetical protein
VNVGDVAPIVTVHVTVDVFVRVARTTTTCPTTALGVFVVSAIRTWLAVQGSGADDAAARSLAPASTPVLALTIKSPTTKRELRFPRS